MSDYAALNVADNFEHDREGCAMHNGDKIARYAFGDLQHSRGGGPADPFEDGQQVMKRQRSVLSISLMVLGARNFDPTETMLRVAAPMSYQKPTSTQRALQRDITWWSLCST